MRSPSRVWVATVFLVLATVVPLCAWYIVGNDGARREADRVRKLTAFRAQRVAIALAERLSGRLEAIREAESHRPSYHYQATFHDPLSDCACASVTASPLSIEPTDPLIRAYFQIDPNGSVELPRLVQAERSQADDAWIRREESLRVSLTSAKAELLGALTVDASVLSSTTSTLRRATVPTLEEQAHTLVNGVLRVGPMRWSTMPVAGENALIARRVVATDSGPFVQGFVIDGNAVHASLDGAYYPADCRLAPLTSAPNEIGSELALPLVSWRVTVDASKALAEADEEASRILAHFRWVFAVVATAASLAGACVIGLVWQSERLARQRSRFAAAAAHELRTPLAGLRLCADMLAGGLGNPAKTKEYAGYLSSEAERLGRVVSNVLGYSRLEHGSISVDARPGDLGPLLTEIVARLEPAMNVAGARVELALPKDMPQVRFDRDAVVHIVQNLIDNAEKYGRGAADRTILVSLALPRDVELTVADRGPGVPDALRSHLFRPFARSDDPAAPAGLGLGLSIVASMAKAHGGSVEYRPRSGGGAEFVVRFPGPESPAQGSRT